MKDFDHVEDIVIDPSFRKWILMDDDQAKQQWLSYLAKHPEKKDLVDTARKVLIDMSNVKYKMTDRVFEQTLQNILAHTSTYAPVEEPFVTKNRIPKYWYAVAAAIGSLLIMASVWWLTVPQVSDQVYQTAYGETQEIQLPDGSKIILNANSSVRFDEKNFLNQRKVYMQGEVFFEVKKEIGNAGLPSDFEVLTQDVAVQVLGTRFNVNTRRADTRVVLEEGKVRLELSGKTDEIVDMEPGDMVTYQHEKKELKKSIVNTEIYLAWKENKLIYKDTPVSEIIEELEDTYGLRIQLQNKEIAGKRYTGTFNKPDPEIILLSLKTLFNLKQEIKNDQIILK